MQAGQDWCLDCGTAAPGRLGARPGWRAAFTVVGLTLLLLVAAVAASYAALTGDAEREAAKPSSGSGNPIVAQTPGVGQAAPVAPGATGPGTTAPPPPRVAPAARGATPSAATNTLQSRTGASTGTSGKTGSSSSSSTSSSSTTTSAQIKLSGASTYDPTGRQGAEFGPAANAVDASTSSVWDVTVPVDGDPLAVGLVLDLGGLYSLKSLTISTPTPGFDVELYGSKNKNVPPDILDSRWEHLTDRANYADGGRIDLKGRGDGKVRFVSLWFPEAADPKDPRVAIGNVKITGTG